MYQYGSSGDRRDFDQGRPVIRTLYDHTGSVNCVSFHPTMAYLFSGGADKTVKVYDLTKPSTQLKALSSISDSSAVQAMAVGGSSFHIFWGSSLKIFLWDENSTFNNLVKLVKHILEFFPPGPSLWRLSFRRNTTSSDSYVRFDNFRVLFK